VIVMNGQAETVHDDHLALAVGLADRAGEVARRYFRQDLTVEQKSDASPVTVADREAEAAMRALIEEHFPDHGIVGEEFGAETKDARFVWVLDPIDGTKRFVTGNALFGCLIGLLDDGQPVLGVIDMPILEERWIGAAGRATSHQDRRGHRQVSTRPCRALDQAALYATSPQMFEGADFDGFETVRRQTRQASYGGECYSYGLLASGFVDL
jgi:inositol-phosphate phosphatase/L-galactose 1-phosphate phosphatase/histidinol-phosphatase